MDKINHCDYKILFGTKFCKQISILMRYIGVYSLKRNICVCLGLKH